MTYTDEQIDAAIEHIDKTMCSDHLNNVKEPALHALAQLKANRWRDIESAPRDGTEVLTFIKRSSNYPNGKIAVRRWEEWSLGAGWSDCNEIFQREITHWKPITPPTDSPPGEAITCSEAKEREDDDE